MVFIDEKEVDNRLENEGCLFDWEEHDKQIRAKAIEGFAKELHRVLNFDGVCFPKTIDRIAEQLKEEN